MQLVKQYKINNNMAQNMRVRASEVAGLAEDMRKKIGQAETPMEEESAIVVVDTLLNMAKGISACFTELYKDIQDCAKVFQPGEINIGVVHQHPVTQEPLAGLVTLAEYTQSGEYTPKQITDYMCRKRAEGVKVPQRKGGVGTAYLFCKKELDTFLSGWVKGSHFGLKGKASRRPTAEPETQPELMVHPKTSMVSLSDFVDQFELDAWRANRLRGFLQQAYYEKAITFREEKAHGVSRYFVYPTEQLEVAAIRWAHQFLGNKNLLVKKH